uniref:Uncharacterized protein n=1 Tax=Glossina austeni TaxID=7395 RepID=A0A1A9V957_GLOAU
MQSNVECEYVEELRQSSFTGDFRDKEQQQNSSLSKIGKAARGTVDSESYAYNKYNQLIRGPKTYLAAMRMDIDKCPIVEAVGYFMIKTLLKEILCGFSLNLHLCTHVFSSYRPKTGGNEIALQQRRQYAAQLIRSGFMRERDETKLFSPKTNSRGVLCERSAVTLGLMLKLQTERLKKHIKP